MPETLTPSKPPFSWITALTLWLIGSASLPIIMTSTIQAGGPAAAIGVMVPSVVGFVIGNHPQRAGRSWTYTIIFGLGGAIPTIAYLRWTTDPDASLARFFATVYPGIAGFALLVIAKAVAGLTELGNKQRRDHDNHCVCGYDLTGNVTGVCPECGTPRTIDK